MAHVLVELRAKAMAMLQPGQELAVCTDAHSDPDRVAIAIARPQHALVITVAKSEYIGLWLAEQLGFPAAAKAPPVKPVSAPLRKKK